MKERPILFSGDMVRALLVDLKRMTRRTQGLEHFSKHDPDNRRCVRIADGVAYFVYKNSPREEAVQCPQGKPGDRLWIKETHQYADWTEDGEPFIRYQADGEILLRDPSAEWADRVVDIWIALSDASNTAIDNKAADRKWRPSIFMPRWASRMNREITGVRVERLMNITDTDCIAEGCPGGHGVIPDYPYNASPFEHFKWIWQSINGHESWAANPWVWVIEFRRAQ